MENIRKTSKNYNLYNNKLILINPKKKRNFKHEYCFILTRKNI